MSDFINRIESAFDPTDQRSKAIRLVTLLELTEQPFAGQFLQNLLAPVEKREPCPGSPQVTGHGLAHVSQPDEPDSIVA